MALSNIQLYSIITAAIIIVVSLVFFMVKKSSPSSVTTTVASDNKAYLPILSEGEGKKTVNVSPKLSYNPSTDVLTAGMFKGDLDGSAKNVKISSDMIQQSSMPQRIVNTGGYQTMNNMDSTIKQGPMRAQGLVGQQPPPTADANKRYLTMTSGTTGNQSLAVSPSMWYDSTNNFLNVDAAKAYNIKRGEANQILVQTGNDNTSFITAPQTGSNLNQYLKWTGQTYEFSTFPEGSSITAAGSPGQLQFNQGGRLGSSSNLSFDNNLLTIGGGLSATGIGNFTGLNVGSTGTITAGTFQGNLIGNASTATNLAGGTSNALHIQSAPNVTSFISPTQGYFRWNSSTGGYEFTPGISATTGTFGGLLTANAGLTVGNGTITAGTGNFTGLTVGSNGTITAGTFQGNLSGNANTATSATTANNLAGGAINRIPVQTGTGTTSFIIAPSTGYLRWNGNAYEFTSAISANTGAFSGLLTAGAGLSANTGNFTGLLNAAAGLSANTGNFTGLLNAAAGTFSGTINANAGINAGSNTITAGLFQGNLAGNANTATSATSANTVLITSIP